MILINPTGQEVEVQDEQAKRILRHPVKILQGWRKKKEAKPESKSTEQVEKKPKGRPKTKVNAKSNNKK